MSRARVAVGVLVLLLGVVGVLATPATSGRLTGKVSNTTNTARASVFGSTSSCAAAATTAGAYFVYPLTEASGLTATNVTGVSGRNGTYTDGGVTYGVQGPCPRDGFKAVTLDGSSGFVQGPLQAAPTTLSIQVWFRTTTTRGGRLAGFGSGGLLTQGSAVSDRQVYMTNTGQLVFGVHPALSSPRTVTTPATYNDGAWHHVVAVYVPSGTTAGLRLYVDGALAIGDTGAGGAATYFTGGMWRFGYDEIGLGWPARPASPYFAGDIASAAVWNAALTGTQVATLHSAGR